MSGAPTSEPNPASTWRSWRIVALLIAFSFMTWFNRVSMSVAYDERIKDQTGISPEAMGYVYSAFLFAYMVFMTPGGWFIDRFGARASLIIMGFGSALFCGLTGLAGSGALVAGGLVWYALFAIRSVMGVFTAPIYPAAARMVSHWIPVTRRAWANGLVQAAAAVGISSTFPVFGALIDFFDWQAAFAIAGIITALLAIAWTMHVTNFPGQHRHVNDAELSQIAGLAAVSSKRNPASDERMAEIGSREPSVERGETGIKVQPTSIRGPDTAIQAQASGSTTPRLPIGDEDLAIDVQRRQASWMALLQNRSLLLLTLSYAAVGYIEYLFFFWMHYYFKEVLHLEESRTYAAILTLSLAVGMIAGGWLADRMRMDFGGWLGRALVPMLAMVAGAGLLVMGVLAVETWATVAWLSLALAAVGAAEAPTWTLAIELGGRHGGTAAAICNTGGNAGGLIAPILTPLVSGLVSKQFGISEQAGWQWGISLGGLIGVAGAVLWCWIRVEHTEEMSE